MKNNKLSPSLVVGLLALKCSLCLLLPLVLIGGLSLTAVFSFIQSPLFILPMALLVATLLALAIRRVMSQPRGSNNCKDCVTADNRK